MHSSSSAGSAVRTANWLKRRQYHQRTLMRQQRSSARRICQKRSANSGRPFLPTSACTGKSWQRKRKRNTSRCTPITSIGPSDQKIRRGRRASEASLSTRRIVRASRLCFHWHPRMWLSMAALHPLLLLLLVDRRSRFQLFTCLRVRHHHRCCQ
jgi:hypothetical protein